MTKGFYNIFGVKRDGGNGKKEFTDLEKDELHKKAQEAIPDNSKTKQATATARSAIEKNIKKVNKAGTVYTVAYGYCTAIDARKYVLAAVVGAELTQLLPVVANFVLSPASMAEGTNAGSGFLDKSMTAAGGLLTDKRADSTGKVGPPVDSIYLQKAMGANSGKVPIPEKFSSIYKVLNNDIYKTADKVGDATEDECNVIESPGAMYTATAVDAAATLYGPYGALKVIGSFALDPIISFATSKIAEFGLQAIVDQLVEKDYISEAQGEELGDVIGMAAAAFFAAGSISRFIPSSSVANGPSVRAARQENEEFQRQMAMAALSPFDTSSRYTFLGSILFNIRSGMLVNGYYNNSFASILSTIANLPSLALSIPKASATVFADNECVYASDYGKDTGDPATTPATSFIGMDCPGFTEYQANMEVDSAIDAMVNEGWIDETKEVEENATIPDLVSSGVIVSDTPLEEYVDSCGDASIGSSFIDPSSCVMSDDGYLGILNNKTTLAQATNQASLGGDFGKLDDLASGDCINDVCYSDVGVRSQITSPKDLKSIAAIPVFLMDYQTNATMNGEDPDEPGVAETTAGTSSAVANTEGWVLPVDEGTAITSPYGNRINPITGASELHDGLDFGAQCGANIYAARAGTATSYTADKTGGFGNGVYIEHTPISGMSALSTFYAHMESTAFTGTQEVAAGEVIGKVGTTGQSTGCHLHFIVYVNGGIWQRDTTVDPKQFYPQLSG